MLKEFIDGNSEEESNYTSKENATLNTIYDKLKSSYAMIDNLPFIYMASQNCSEMILYIGNTKSGSRKNPFLYLNLTLFVVFDGCYRQFSWLNDTKQLLLKVCKGDNSD
jgi:hypothetical protein